MPGCVLLAFLYWSSMMSVILAFALTAHFINLAHCMS